MKGNSLKDNFVVNMMRHDHSYYVILFTSFILQMSEDERKFSDEASMILSL